MMRLIQVTMVIEQIVTIQKMILVTRLVCIFGGEVKLNKWKSIRVTEEGEGWFEGGGGDLRGAWGDNW